MIAQTDSIVTGTDTLSSPLPSGSDGGGHYLTPAMVLSWLPRDATPAQQDSAIQAHFKPREIRWSERPDTLHLPGHDKGVDVMKANLPQYYRESFFSKDSLFATAKASDYFGVAGDPVPYAVHNDDVITSLLLAFFMLVMIALSNARNFIVRQTKQFFYVSHGNMTEISETSNELRFQVFLVVLTSLMLAMLFYFYTVNYIGETFVLQSDYQLIGVYFLVIVAYYLLKLLLYTIVNSVFFTSKQNIQWLKTHLFISALQGVALFPAVVVLAYFNLSLTKVFIYCLAVLFMSKMLTIYRCFVIFFREKVAAMQIFVYLCALEMTPLLILWSTLVSIGNNLKVSF